MFIVPINKFDEDQMIVFVRDNMRLVLILQT